MESITGELYSGLAIASVIDLISSDITRCPDQGAQEAALLLSWKQDLSDMIADSVQRAQWPASLGILEDRRGYEGIHTGEGKSFGLLRRLRHLVADVTGCLKIKMVSERTAANDECYVSDTGGNSCISEHNGFPNEDLSVDDSRTHSRTENLGDSSTQPGYLERIAKHVSGIDLQMKRIRNLLSELNALTSDL